MKYLLSATSTVVGLLLLDGLCVASDTVPIGEVVEVRGHALVNSGEYFSPAHAGLPLILNDRLFVLDESRLTLATKDGCAIEMSGNESLSLTSVSLCTHSENKQSIETIPPGVVSLADERDSLLGGALLSGEGGATVFGVSTLTAVLGGLATLGVGLAIFLETGSESQSNPPQPISP